MTLCNGGFLPFELGELTGKSNHPLEQVPWFVLDLDLDAIAVSLYPGSHVHEVDLNNTLSLSPTLGACHEGESDMIFR